MSAPPSRVPKDDSTLMTVERGLKVLRAFRAERTPLSNAELVRRTGLSKATVSRLTSTLLQLNFLRRIPGRREFELSQGAVGIGRAYLANDAILDAAQPLMQELADHFDASVALGVQDNLDMLYVGYCVSSKVATLRMGVGSILPMATTSIGRAYLWGLPPDERNALVKEHIRLAGPQGPALQQGIAASFAELDSVGTCAVLDGFQRDTCGVALPIRLGRQGVLLSMSCGKANVQLDLPAEHARITPALKLAAARLEKQLSELDEQF